MDITIEENLSPIDITINDTGLDYNITVLVNQSSGGSTELPILDTYPTTDPTKVGQKFIFRGYEWKYHSQAELDDLGWTTVSEGFPASVNKSFLINLIITSDSDDDWDLSGISIFNRNIGDDGNIEIDFSCIGSNVININAVPNITILNGGITLFRNAELLTNLKDIGTRPAIDITATAFPIVCSAETLNDLFTQLPPTTYTASIKINSTTGAATCDPSIATAKGYTVVTI